MTLNNDRETNQTDKQINRLTQTDRQTDREKINRQRDAARLTAFVRPLLA